MNSNFEIGDEVICTYNYAYIRYGTRVKVIGISKTGSLKLLGINGYYDHKNFKLYKRASNNTSDTTAYVGDILDTLMSVLSKTSSVVTSEVIDIMNTFENVSVDDTKAALRLALEKGLIKINADLRIEVAKFKTRTMYKVTAYNHKTNKREDIDYFDEGDPHFSSLAGANLILNTIARIRDTTDSNRYSNLTGFCVEEVEVTLPL